MEGDFLRASMSASSRRRPLASIGRPMMCFSPRPSIRMALTVEP